MKKTVLCLVFLVYVLNVFAGIWLEGANEDLMTGKKSIYFYTDSEATDYGRTATLYLRLKEEDARLQIYIYWDEYLGTPDYYFLEYKFDDEKIHDKSYSTSTNKRATFLSTEYMLTTSTYDFVKKMLNHKKVIFRVLDFSHTPYTAKFDLTGFKDLYKKYKVFFEAYEIINKMPTFKILFFSKNDKNAYYESYFPRNHSYPKTIQDYANWAETPEIMETLKNFSYEIQLEKDVPTIETKDKVTIYIKTESKPEEVVSLIKKYIEDPENWSFNNEKNIIIYKFVTDF